MTDTAQRAAIGDYYRRAWEAYASSPAFAGARGGDDPARTQVQTRIGDSGWHLGRHMGDVPVLVLPCLRISAGSLAAGNQADVWGSLLPAAWTYCLAARARGLGTAWTTLHLDYERESPTSSDCRRTSLRAPSSLPPTTPVTPSSPPPANPSTRCSISIAGDAGESATSWLVTQSIHRPPASALVRPTEGST